VGQPRPSERAQSGRVDPSGRIGLDVGGTAVKAGQLDAAGAIASERELPLGEGGIGELVRLLAELVRGFEGGLPNSLGLAVAGLVDRAAGRVEVSPNIHFLDGVALGPALEAELGLAPGAVRLVNDANAAALGEARLGGGCGRSDLLFITLGTGVGGGLVLGGELWEGCGLAGEIGHVKIATDGPLCGCGRRGCLETFASATAASRRAQERGLPAEDPGDLIGLSACARRRPGPERQLLEEVGRDLGLGIAAVVNLLDVRCFVFGGGFGQAFDLLAPGMHQGLEQGSYGERLSQVELLPANLGPAAGWIGAALLGNGHGKAGGGA
jgi:glucokinase